MPPQIQALLQDKRILAGIGGAIVLILILVFVFAGHGGSKDPGDAPLSKDQKTLATINGIGKAIEIQALLARQGIHLTQTAESDKVTLAFEDTATQKDRDKALITMVQSGLMDKNVGLEAFEKGDLTASREEKRIKLIRAQQGELARLIRKIDPIEDASVNIAIPEQTLFRSEEKPISASVQVTMPVATMLTRNQVRAITNLVVGSIQGLDAKHLTLSDTNGNTYSSVLDAGDQIGDELEEQDSYMKQKVAAQLDHLVGAGNYVVTVSTELREAPRETMVQEYDPQGGVVSSKQSFNENLNTNGGGPAAGGPASSFLPNNMTAAVSGATPNKDYLRNGVEVSYNNSKTQWVETRPVGMLEDISVAVTIDANHFPEGMSTNDLQTLLAHAASPKVKPENVSIVRSEPRESPAITHSDMPESQPDLSWLYWAGGAIVFCLLAILLLSLRKNTNSNPEVSENFEQAQQELAQLRDMAMQQQAQIQATQQQTQMLLEAQQRQIQQTQSMEALESNTTETARQLSQSGGGLQQTLDELREVVANPDLEEDNLNMQIKSWIESS